ncbi:MAG: hypothetical protein ACOY4R_20925 [Pseudomonadota bacterium]
MDDQVSIARRIAFLERELERMGSAAEDAEQGLRDNPTDLRAGGRLKAIYALAGDTWADIKALRARQSGGCRMIHYDHTLDAAWRQALV